MAIAAANDGVAAAADSELRRPSRRVTVDAALRITRQERLTTKGGTMFYYFPTIRVVLGVHAGADDAADS